MKKMFEKLCDIIISMTNNVHKACEIVPTWLGKNYIAEYAKTLNFKIQNIEQVNLDLVEFFIKNNKLLDASFRLKLINMLFGEKIYIHYYNAWIKILNHKIYDALYDLDKAQNYNNTKDIIHLLNGGEVTEILRNQWHEYFFLQKAQECEFALGEFIKNVVQENQFYINQFIVHEHYNKFLDQYLPNLIYKDNDYNTVVSHLTSYSMKLSSEISILPNAEYYFLSFILDDKIKIGLGGSFTYPKVHIDQTLQSMGLEVQKSKILDIKNIAYYFVFLKRS